MTDYYVCEQTVSPESVSYYGPYTTVEKDAIIKQRLFNDSRTCHWMKIGQVSDSAVAEGISGRGVWYTILPGDRKPIGLFRDRLPLWRMLCQMNADNHHEIQMIYRGMHNHETFTK